MISMRGANNHHPMGETSMCSCGLFIFIRLFLFIRCTDHGTDKHTVALTPAHEHYRSQIIKRPPPLMHNADTHIRTILARTPPQHRMHIPSRIQNTIACTPPKRRTSTITRAFIAREPLRKHRADVHRADMHQPAADHIL